MNLKRALKKNLTGTWKERVLKNGTLKGTQKWICTASFKGTLKRKWKGTLKGDKKEHLKETLKEHWKGI